MEKHIQLELLDIKKDDEQFFRSDEFAEALAMVWGFGSQHTTYFVLRSPNKEILNRFKQIVRNPVSMFDRNIDKEYGTYTQWNLVYNSNHPFILQIKKLGWTPKTHQVRNYPVGNFNEDVFVQTYIRLHYTLDTICARKQYIRPRIRINGSKNVLYGISTFLEQRLGIGKKKPQKHQKSTTTSTIYYHSREEIPIMLKYIEDFEALQKFESMKLGYVNRGVMS